MLCLNGSGKPKGDPTKTQQEEITAKKLPEQFERVIFTKKRMVSMATVSSNRVTHGSVRLLDDPREINQKLTVTTTCRQLSAHKSMGIVSGL